jgi:hypothetical protein
VEFCSRLTDGYPAALGFVGLIVLGLVADLSVFKVRRDLHREDETQAARSGR